MWEELAFYEGFALTWKAIMTKQGRQDEFEYLFLSSTDLWADSLPFQADS
jgi:hypothetical protein